MNGDGPERPHRPDRLSVVVERSLEPDSLVGSFFHSGHERGWQGVVVAEPAPGIYLVETFEWLAGSSHDQQMVRLEDMLTEGWSFYDDAQWMVNSYENRKHAQWERQREQAEQSDGTSHG